MLNCAHKKRRLQYDECVKEGALTGSLDEDLCWQMIAKLCTALDHESFIHYACLNIQKIFSRHVWILDPRRSTLFHLSLIVVVFTCTPCSLGRDMMLLDAEFHTLVIMIHSSLGMPVGRDSKHVSVKDLFDGRDYICKQLGYDFSWM